MVSLKGCCRWPTDVHETVIQNFLKWYDTHQNEMSPRSQAIVNVLLKNEHHDDDDPYVAEYYEIYPGALRYECRHGHYYEPFDEIGEKLSLCSPDIVFTASNWGDVYWDETLFYVIRNGKKIDEYTSRLCAVFDDKQAYVNVFGANEDVHPTDDLPTGYFYVDKNDVDETNKHSITKEQFDEMVNEWRATPNKGVECVLVLL